MRCEPGANARPKGIAASGQEMAATGIARAHFHGEWNTRSTSRRAIDIAVDSRHSLNRFGGGADYMDARRFYFGPVTSRDRR